MADAFSKVLSSTGKRKPPNAGKGRKKGVPNKATRDVREVIAQVAKANVGKLTEWLEAIEDPSKRMDLFLRMCEYHIPKLGRLEHTGEDGGPIQVTRTRYAPDDKAA